MKKFDKNNYKFIDLSETDISQFSQIEIDNMIADTVEVLKMTKGSVTKTPMNLGLIGGVLGARGGQFVSVNFLTGAKWKKGDATKEEQKLAKKVFFTARIYYAFKVIITLIAQKNNEGRDLLNPTLVQKI